MKELDLSSIVANTRRLLATKQTLLHMQEGITESLSRMMLGLGVADTDVTVLTGCVNSATPANYAISAGSVYYNGEIFEVPVFSGTAGGGQVPILTLQTTYRAGDPVLYTDGTSHNTHANRKLVWSFGTSGLGIKDFSQLVQLSTKISTLVLATANAYADSLVVGLWDDRGNYNASTNLFPATGGSGSAGAIKKGDIWTVSVIGTLGGVAVSLGDTVRAIADTPGQTAGNWAIAEANLGYTPENVVNKDIDATLAANSDTKYASQKATKTYADTKQVALGFSPVQQGTGVGQLTNLIKIGYGADSRLHLTVDVSDIGIILTNTNLDESTLTWDGTSHASVKDAGITPAKLSVKVVQSPDAVQLYTKVIQIGDWNMDTTSPINVAHGLGGSFKKIRSVRVVIRDDADTTYYMLEREGVGGVVTIDGTNIIITRVNAGIFDDPAFDATSYNRGYVTIIYEA